MDCITERPLGIAVDAAHSRKNNKTEYQAVDIFSGKQLFYYNIGNKTVNIGEFLAIVDAVKYIIENDYKPKIIWSDSKVALSWFKEKGTSSCKKDITLLKASVFLQAFSDQIDKIEVRYWDNSLRGENPADFGNK